MSKYFNLGDPTSGNAPSGASRLMSQVTVSPVELVLPSGLGAMEADECPIDLLAWIAR